MRAKLTWYCSLGYLDEVCDKRAPFPSLRSTHGSFSDPPSDISDNRLSKLREIRNVPIAIAFPHLTPYRFGSNA